MVDQRQVARWLLYVCGLVILASMPSGGLSPVVSIVCVVLTIPYLAYVVSDLLSGDLTSRR